MRVMGLKARPCEPRLRLMEIASRGEQSVLQKRDEIGAEFQMADTIAPGARCHAGGKGSGTAFRVALPAF